MNIDPYLSAMRQLQVIALSRQTLVPSQAVFSAISGVHAALAPENIPGLPGVLREEIAQSMAGMGNFVHPDRRFPVLVARVFLVQLRNRGWGGVGGGNTDEVTAAIDKLIQGAGQDSAAQVQRGVEILFMRGTIRGMGLEFLQAGMAVRLLDAATTPDSSPAVGEPAHASATGLEIPTTIPLVDPKTGPCRGNRTLRLPPRRRHPRGGV